MTLRKAKTPPGKATLFAMMLLCLLGSAASAKQVTLDLALDKPLLLADQTQTAHMRVGLKGFRLDDDMDRSPLNVAIVLDKSGSMQGQKIESAKEAALMALRRLDGRDIVSIITYDSTVGVLVPATRASDRESIARAIHGIRAGGETALFAGVSKGAAEVRKFLDNDHVNRIVLLSDGQANVGPSSPEYLGGLGASLSHEGITITTIGLGLGYNEDLMAQLALRSDGHHYFAEGTSDLARAFDEEFGNALSVVAQGIEILIRCAPGVRPIRFLGIEREIDGQMARLSLNNLFSEGERRVILEVEVTPEAARRDALKIATVKVDYQNLATRSKDHIENDLTADLTESLAAVEANLDDRVMIDVVKLQAVEQNQLAVALRDQGKIAEALEMLLSNSAFLSSNALKLGSEELEDYAKQQRLDADNLDEESWARQRKENSHSAVKALY